LHLRPCGLQRYFPIWPCSRRGFPCRRVLPPTRCALTAPFHPCRHPDRIAPRWMLGRSILCCTFRGLTPPRCYLAPCPLEPGLSSPLHPCGCHAAIAQPAPPRRTIAATPARCLPIAARASHNLQCTSLAGPADGKLVVEVVDAGHVKGAVQIKAQQMSVDMKIDGKWLGADCGATK
jgi:hypothetical protein